MAFLVQQHAATGRAVSGKMAAAAARKGRPRHGPRRAAAKNPGKPEPRHRGRQLALRLLAACLLAPAACACAARLAAAVLPPPPLSPPAGNGVHLTFGSRAIGSDDAQGVGAVSSWEGTVGVRVTQEPDAAFLARDGADSFRDSPESGEGGDINHKDQSVKNGTRLEIKSGIEEQTMSSAEFDTIPENSRQVEVTDIEVSKPRSKIYCDDKSKDEGFPYARPIVCQMSGVVQVIPGSSLVALNMPTQQSKDLWRIRPYARQDDSLLPLVREVVIRAAASKNDAPMCNISHDVPAIIFSIGGYTGNFFHDMSDVLIPLYLTSFRFKGRVQFFITNYKQWWIQKYKPMLRRLSHYDIIDFDSNKDVHCFQHVILGLLRDRDLILRLHPTRNPKGYSMLDFTRFLRHSYGLRRDRALILGEQPGKKPRMLIISRRGTRKLLNLRRVEAVSKALGFDVIISEAHGNLKKFAMLVNSCDVLLAVHGAGLTNQVFLPAQAVVIQIVPWGRMDWMANNFYGEPARGMDLRYLEYYISEEESSLAQRYPRDHIVFKDPMAIHSQGWNALADIVMTQDVRLNLRRFRPTLLQALDLLQV